MEVKRIITYVIVAVLLLSLVGCNRSMKPMPVDTSDISDSASLAYNEDEIQNAHESSILYNDCELVQWEDAIDLGEFSCMVNTTIKIETHAPTAQAELDEFTIDELQLFLDYFLPNSSVNVNTLPFNNTILYNGQAVRLQYNEHIYSISKYADTIVQLEKWILRGNAYPGEPQGTSLTEIHITAEKALEVANNVIYDLQIENCSLSNISKARLLDEKNMTRSEGWYISYVLTINNLAPFDVAYTTGYGDMQFNNELTDTSPWPQQRVDCFVDENGVQQFRFANRVKLSEEINNVVLLPFSEIQSTIVECLQNGYNNYNPNDEADIPYIQSVFLTNCLLSSELNKEKAIMTPVWVATITNGYYNANYLDPFYITVDAVDGKQVSVIY